jgi:branched-chain amino acid transport system ATP-binding protein
LLSVAGLSAWYGEAQVLRNVDLTVGEGEVVTLVGRNGAGKTTLLRCLMGLHRKMDGDITFAGQHIARLPAHRRTKLGLGYVPDDRGVYSTLTVEENLRLPPANGDSPWSLKQVYEAFPALEKRRKFPGTKLSGGEQQMLALARVLRMGARMLVCDEPTEGLSPLLVDQIGDILTEVKSRGITVLLIEQNVSFAARVADRHYLLVQGEVAETMNNSEVQKRESELLDYLGI